MYYNIDFLSDTKLFVKLIIRIKGRWDGLMQYVADQGIIKKESHKKYFIGRGYSLFSRFPNNRVVK
jgi:hypothetical protein